MKEDKKDAVQEIFATLEQGVKDFYDGEKFKKYLDTVSKFHNYSFNNTLLIAMQKPDATLVAGYNAWKNNFKRQVQKGEKGIKIFAPSPIKMMVTVDKTDDQGNIVWDKSGNPQKETVEKTILKFKVVNVFDVSQTEGEEIPKLIETLTGDIHEYNFLFSALEEASPVPITFENISDAHGYFHPGENRIALQEGESQIQTIKTLIHEIAHATLHNLEKQKEDPKDRRTQEIEAESVAYVVSNYFGIDTSEYSFAYVAGWGRGRDAIELKNSMEVIKETASKLIQEIEGNLLEIQKLKSREPVVTILWSESRDLNTGDQFPLSVANELFEKLDADMQSGEMGYYKTKFEIHYMGEGIRHRYEGRYDIGDGDGSLIEHIQNYHEAYLDDPAYKEYIIRNSGEEAWEIDRQIHLNVIEELIPYFKFHCNLSDMEKKIEDRTEDNLTEPQRLFYQAMENYVTTARDCLNTGNYENFPPVPKIQDFILQVDQKEMAAYKERVKEEINQEAKVAGMTVEEYAANDYEPVKESGETNKGSLLGKLRENKENLQNPEEKQEDRNKQIKDQLER